MTAAVTIAQMTAVLRIAVFAVVLAAGLHWGHTFVAFTAAGAIASNAFFIAHELDTAGVIGTVWTSCTAFVLLDVARRRRGIDLPTSIPLRSDRR